MSSENVLDKLLESITLNTDASVSSNSSIIYGIHGKNTPPVGVQQFNMFNDSIDDYDENSIKSVTSEDEFFSRTIYNEPSSYENFKIMKVVPVKNNNNKPSRVFSNEFDDIFNDVKQISNINAMRNKTMDTSKLPKINYELSIAPKSVDEVSLDVDNKHQYNVPKNAVKVSFSDSNSVYNSILPQQPYNVSKLNNDNITQQSNKTSISRAFTTQQTNNASSMSANDAVCAFDKITNEDECNLDINSLYIPAISSQYPMDRHYEGGYISVDRVQMHKLILLIAQLSSIPKTVVKQNSRAIIFNIGELQKIIYDNYEYIMNDLLQQSNMLSYPDIISKQIDFKDMIKEWKSFGIKPNNVGLKNNDKILLTQDARVFGEKFKISEFVKYCNELDSYSVKKYLQNYFGVTDLSSDKLLMFSPYRDEEKIGTDPNFIIIGDRVGSEIEELRKLGLPLDNNNNIDYKMLKGWEPLYFSKFKPKKVDSIPIFGSHPSAILKTPDNKRKTNSLKEHINKKKK
jgi:hypothetical protein